MQRKFHMFARARLVMMLVALVSVALSAGAQVNTAGVVGTITDPSGAVVANAAVTIKNVDTGIIRTAQAGSNGDYLFTLLQVGTYQVSVEAKGFKAFVAKDVTLAVGDRARIDVKLQVGGAAETVAVSASSAPALDTDTSTVGALLPSQILSDMPLNGRNLTDLIRLAPGVTGNMGTGAGASMAVGYSIKTQDSRPYSSYSANGQTSETNNNMIDGADNNEVVFGVVGVRPSLDAVQEVQVQTNLYTAETGRTAGGAVDVISKSGTNAFHGSFYEFLRNDLLNSRLIIPTTANPNKAELRQNQFGASLGGPIKKDKTFFFGDFEGYRQVQGLAITALVPTAKLISGDFSELYSATPATNALCKGRTGALYINPSTNAVQGTANGNCLLQQLYNAGITTLAGAGIPSTKFDAMGVKMLSLYPAPNANLTTPLTSLIAGTGGVNYNYTNQPRQTQYVWTYDGRIDHHFRQADTLTGHYTFNDYATTVPSNYPAVSGVFGGGGDISAERAQMLSLDELHIFRPNLLLDVKASYLRFANNVRANNGAKAATTFGWPCTATSCINAGGASSNLPNISQGTNISWGAWGDSQSLPLNTTDNSYQYTGTLTWIRGSHDIKMGGSLVRRLVYFWQSGNGSTGQFHIDGGATGSFTTDALIGASGSVTRGTANVGQHLRNWEPNAYVQDNWRALPWLTLNLGMRWEMVTPYSEENGYMANFDPVQQLIVSPVLTGTQQTDSHMGLKTQYRNFSPRVGFSASLKHNLVVRGGFGMTYFTEPDTAAQGYSVLFQNNIGCGFLGTEGSAGGACGGAGGTYYPAMTFTNVPTVTDTATQNILNALPGDGFAQISAGIMPPLSLAAAETAAQDRTKYASMLLGVSMANVTPYLYQWSMQVEKQYGANVLTLGYVGNAGRHAHAGANINEMTPDNLAPLSLLPATKYQIWMSETTGTSSYNALQAMYTRRYAKGLTSNLSYTWSHAMSLGVLEQMGPANNLECARYGCQEDNPTAPTSPVTVGQKHDYGNSDLDMRQRISYMTSYELPFGKNYKGVLGAITKGWGASTSGYWQSGIPFSVNFNGNDAGSINNPRASQVANPKNLSSSCSTMTAGANYSFNPCAFATPTQHTWGPIVGGLPSYGYWGNERRAQLFGPHTWTVNAQAGKTFAITERFKLNFRGEAFNLTNTTNNPMPGSTVGNASLGKMVRTGSTGRQFQFGLRLSY